jgi:hypothetical protein
MGRVTIFLKKVDLRGQFWEKVAWTERLRMSSIIAEILFDPL